MVNARTHRWNAENSKECKGCSLHVEESVFHLIVECMGYERERIILMNVVKVVFGNDIFERWYVNEHKGMCQLLGLCDSNSRILEAMKVFLESAWKERGALQGRVNEMCLHGNDHNC